MDLARVLALALRWCLYILSRWSPAGSLFLRLVL